MSAFSFTCCQTECFAYIYMWAHHIENVHFFNQTLMLWALCVKINLFVRNNFPSHSDRIYLVHWTSGTIISFDVPVLTLLLWTVLYRCCSCCFSHHSSENKHIQFDVIGYILVDCYSVLYILCFRYLLNPLVGTNPLECSFNLFSIPFELHMMKNSWILVNIIFILWIKFSPTGQ